MGLENDSVREDLSVPGSEAQDHSTEWMQSPSQEDEVSAGEDSEDEESTFGYTMLINEDDGNDDEKENDCGVDQTFEESVDELCMLALGAIEREHARALSQPSIDTLAAEIHRELEKASLDETPSLNHNYEIKQREKQEHEQAESERARERERDFAMDSEHVEMIKRLTAQFKISPKDLHL